VKNPVEIMKLKNITNRFVRSRKAKAAKKSIISYDDKDSRTSPKPKSYNSSDTEEDSQGPVSPSPPAKDRDGINIVTSPVGNKLSFSDEPNIDFDQITKSTESVQNYSSDTDDIFHGLAKSDKSTTNYSVEDSHVSSTFLENPVGNDVHFGNGDDQGSKLSSVNLDDQNSESRCSPSVTPSSLKEESSLFTHATKNTNVVVLKKPPTARQAAFSGPPRYDWIDVEASAALKVQSLYRRHRVTSDLQRQGIVTTVMQRKFQQRKARDLDNDGMLSLYQCCSLSSLLQAAFSDADEVKMEAETKATYQERKKAQAETEERLRKFRMRKRDTENLIESIEVVV